MEGASGTTGRTCPCRRRLTGGSAGQRLHRREPCRASSSRPSRQPQTPRARQGHLAEAHESEPFSFCREGAESGTNPPPRPVSSSTFSPLPFCCPESGIACVIHQGSAQFPFLAVPDQRATTPVITLTCCE